MLFLTTNLDSFVSLNVHNSGSTVFLDFLHPQLEMSRLQDAKWLGIWVTLLSPMLNRKKESGSCKSCAEH